MTIFACEVEHKSNVVWSCPLRLPPHELQSTFMLLKNNTKSASEWINSAAPLDVRVPRAQ